MVKNWTINGQQIWFFLTAFPFLMDWVTYLVLARENNHHGGISSVEQKDFTGRHSAANTSGRNNRPNATQQNA